MLTLLYGACGSGKSARLADDIAARVEGRQRTYLLVPEQQTVGSERRMAETLPPFAPLCFEVTNFSRLANTVFRAVGGLSFRYATPGTHALLLWRAIAEAGPLLKEFPGQPDPGAVRVLQRVLQELQAAGISPAALRAAAARLLEGRLAARLSDYALLFSVYRDSLRQLYSDASEDLDRAAMLLQEHPFFAGAAVFADGFTSFTEQQYTLLARLLGQCDLTVTLPLPEDTEGYLCYAELWECRRRLLRLAEMGNVEVREASCGEYGRSSSPLLRYVLPRLWRVDYAHCAPYSGTQDDALRLIQTNDAFTEATFVAADIARRVQCEGASYRDFSILLRSSAGCVGILDRALERGGIPYFLSAHTDPAALEPIKLLYAAYAVCESWKRTEVITYLKCGLSGVSADDCDEFELYTAQWSIHGRQFTEPEDWNMNPDGLVPAFSEAGKAKLARINATRRRLLASLAPLEAGCVRQSARAHATVLCNFLLSLDLEKQLQKRSLELAQAGRTSDAELYGRLWGVICDALDRLVETMADTELTPDQFVQLLRLLFGEADMGRIPSSCDAVTIGSADLLRTEGVKHVYLLDVNEGVFPAAVGDESTFSPAERQALADVGLELHEDTSVHASRELFCFLRALSSAEETVTVVSPLSDSSFTPCAEASVLARIRHLAGEALCTVRWEARSPAERLWNLAAVLEESALLRSPEGESLRQALRDEPAYQRLCEVLQIPLCDPVCRLPASEAEALFPRVLSLTQSRLEQYVHCHFSYFAHYLLRLDENRPATFGRADIGNMVHEILEQLFRSLQEEGVSLVALSDAEVATRVEEVSTAYIRQIYPDRRSYTARQQYLTRRLRRAVNALLHDLRAEFAHSKFTPAFFELPVDRRRGDCPDPFTVPLDDGAEVFIRGIIDRVDLYRHEGKVYLRVVDYKTGHKEFSMGEVQKGRQLQLLLYLFALWKSRNPLFLSRLGLQPGEEIVPAGMLYLEANLNEVTPKPGQTREQALREHFRRTGLLLADEQILQAMDDAQEGHFLPVGKSSSVKTRMRCLYTMEQLEEMQQRVTETVRSIATQMRTGNADITATGERNSPCDYCAAMPFCRHRQS